MCCLDVDSLRVTMAADRHFARINTQELKDVIYKKIGRQRADKYFEQLKRFLGYKLSKSTLDKSCLQTIGRENIPLHNRLIRAIIQNSCQARLPSHKPRQTAVNGYQRTCFQSRYADGLPSSPRKCRSPRDRKLRDRPSPLGKSPSLTYEETVTRVQDSTCSKVEEGEEVEQFAERSRSGWSSITAPFGIQPASSSYKPLHLNFTNACYSSGELPDTGALIRRLDKKVAAEGLTISPEGANAINRGLDAYLKRVLETFLAVPRTRQLSVLDFLIAMETNPSVLGENWPALLEQISHQSFE